MKIQLKKIALTYCCFGIISAVNAQLSRYSYTTAGSVYTQNFDGMPEGLPAAGLELSSGLPSSIQGPFDLSVTNADLPAATNMVGWQVYKVLGSGRANAVALAVNGRSPINGFIFAANSLSATNRALGFAKGNTLQKAAVGVVITNNTGHTLTSFSIKYIAQQWRSGFNTLAETSDTLSCKYALVPSSVQDISSGTYISIQGADFTTKVPYCLKGVVGGSGSCSAKFVNGTLPKNQETKSLKVSGIVWKAGDNLNIRWEDLNGYKNGGTPEQSSIQSAVAIDDFVFQANK